MDAFRQDLAVGMRSLGKAPGFSAFAVTRIACGIATTVFVWSPTNAILLRPLPYQDSGRIVQRSSDVTTERRDSYGSWSHPDYEDARDALARIDPATALRGD